MPAGSRRLYMTPYDHAFASGPVFTRPESLEAARAEFDRAEDADLLWRIFEAFSTHATSGARLRLGLKARIVSKNREPMVTIGDDCAIRGILRCEPGGRISIGSTVYIGDDVIISAQSGISIGDTTLLAHGVQIFDNDTHPTDPAEREAHFKAILGVPHSGSYQIATRPVRIGGGCWLGFNSAVMKGVTIGDGSIVAASSVVIDDVPPRSLVAGNPARVVKSFPAAGQRAAG
jgi:acetyltransferase-like isoleucine patch superfamily enzyme